MGTEIFDEYEKVFQGNQFAIGLKYRNRAAGDKHVCVDIIHEDDGNWFLSEHGFSSFWLPDLMLILQEADVWMRKHCMEDGKFGYKFGK